MAEASLFDPKYVSIYNTEKSPAQKNLTVKWADETNSMSSYDSDDDKEQSSNEVKNDISDSFSDENLTAQEDNINDNAKEHKIETKFAANWSLYSERFVSWFQSSVGCKERENISQYFGVHVSKYLAPRDLALLIFSLWCDELDSDEMLSGYVLTGEPQYVKPNYAKCSNLSSDVHERMCCTLRFLSNNYALELPKKSISEKDGACSAGFRAKTCPIGYLMTDSGCCVTEEQFLEIWSEEGMEKACAACENIPEVTARALADTLRDARQERLAFIVDMRELSAAEKKFVTVGLENYRANVFETADAFFAAEGVDDLLNQPNSTGKIDAEDEQFQIGQLGKSVGICSMDAKDISAERAAIESILARHWSGTENSGSSVDKAAGKFGELAGTFLRTLIRLVKTSFAAMWSIATVVVNGVVRPLARVSAKLAWWIASNPKSARSMLSILRFARNTMATQFREYLDETNVLLALETQIKSGKPPTEIIQYMGPVTLSWYEMLSDKTGNYVELVRENIPSSTSVAQYILKGTMPLIKQNASKIWQTAKVGIIVGSAGASIGAGALLMPAALNVGESIFGYVADSLFEKASEALKLSIEATIYMEDITACMDLIFQFLDPFELGDILFGQKKYPNLAAEVKKHQNWVKSMQSQLVNKTERKKEISAGPPEVLLLPSKRQ